MEFLTDPMQWWIDPFTSNPFMQRALLAGLLAVLATSIVGTWVVLRGMSFLGDALAHGVLPGIAIAAVVGFVIDEFSAEFSKKEDQEHAAKAARDFRQCHSVEHIASRLVGSWPLCIRFHCQPSRDKRRDQST